MIGDLCSVLLISISNFFMTLMDENIVSKTANALVNPYELNNWKSKNIYPINIGEKFDKEVSDNILIHKLLYVQYLSKKLNTSLDDVQDQDNEYYQIIENLMKLKKLEIEINKTLQRSPITKSYINF